MICAEWRGFYDWYEAHWKQFQRQGLEEPIRGYCQISIAWRAAKFRTCPFCSAPMNTQNNVEDHEQLEPTIQ